MKTMTFSKEEFFKTKKIFYFFLKNFETKKFLEKVLKQDCSSQCQIFTRIKLKVLGSEENSPLKVDKEFDFGLYFVFAQITSIPTINITCSISYNR